MITHVVLMKFADPAVAPEAKARLESLVGRVPQLLSMQVGTDVLRTDASYDLCLTTTHDDLPALKGYQDHPAHQDFIGWLRPQLSGRVVVDYEG